MRSIVLPFALWLGILQQTPLGMPSPVSVAGAAQLLGMAATMASLTVVVYRLGVWRQQMYDTKHDVGAEVARHREESNKSFERLERRFQVVDQFIAAATEQRVVTERWQAEVNMHIEGHDRELEFADGRLARLEVERAHVTA